MRVKDIGEFNLIELLAETLEAGSTACVDGVRDLGYRLRKSIGDDAAAWDGPGATTVFTADALVEGVHFDLERIGWSDLGWKALAVNLSDIAAMGCAPLYSLITLGLRGDFPVEGLRKMYAGMSEACRRYGGAPIGGDIVSSPTLFIAVSMVGAAHAADDGSGAGMLISRAAAQPGDRVAVTGSLGCSGAALRAMSRKLDLDETTAAHLMAAHNRPTPRVAEGMLLARRRVLAAIDISDGLVDDLGKLCKASGVGAMLHANLVPADEHLRRAFPNDWLPLALSGGEDYELLFTAPPTIMDEAVSQLDVQVSVIGDIVAEPKVVTVLDEDGKAMELNHMGWDHFAG